MFRCFSHHLLGNEEEHDAVRTLIIRFENFNRHYFKPLLMSNNEPTLKAHVSKMCRPFTWGTQIEIQAVACLFQVPVYECVQSQDGETYHIIPEHQLTSFAFLLLQKTIQFILQSFPITLSLPIQETVTMIAQLTRSPENLLLHPLRFQCNITA